MQGVANVSFLAMFLMYLLAALFGYLTFNGKLFFFSFSCIEIAAWVKYYVANSAP